MSRIIDQLVYKITGDNAEFDKALDESDKNVSKFGSTANKILAGVTVAAIAMTVKKLGEMAIASAQALDRVDKMSQKIGISRQAFQEWDFILAQSGASVDGLQAGLKTLSSFVDMADKGNQDAVETFDRLGIAIYDVNGNLKNQETLFNESFTALQNMEAGTERTAISTKLLGRAATELAPALNTASADIEALRAQAHSLGKVYNDELIDAGVRLGDNIDSLRGKFEAIKTRALSPVITAMVAVTDKMLGQDSKSKDLLSVTEKLVGINKDYKTALDNVATGTDGVTSATVEQLAVERQMQLFKLENTYFESKKELESLNATITKNQAINSRNNKVLDDMAAKYGVSRIRLAELYAQEQLSTDNRDRYKDAIDAVNESYYNYAEAVAKSKSATINQTQFIDVLIQGYLDGSINIERFIGLDLDLYNSILKGVPAYEARIAAQKAEADAQAAATTTTEEGTTAVVANTDAIVAQADALTEVEKDWSSYNNAITTMSDDTTFKFLSNLVDQAQAFRDAGVSEVAIEEWKAKEIAKWQDGITQKELDEIAKRKQANIQYGTQIANSFSQAWGYINTIQENNNESELARMEAQGASAEQLATKKKQFAIEEAKRSKSQASFQALIDTASAIIGFLANPGGPWGVALSVAAGATGAAQLAAINSAPLPSFDVGSIRIPETQQATVHQGEMILPVLIAQEARQAGITIAPNGGSGGSTVFMVYLDGKKIAESTVGHINSGGVNRIDARVVK